MLLLIGPTGLTARLRLTLLLGVSGGCVCLTSPIAAATQFQAGFMRQAGTEGAAAAQLALSNLSGHSPLAPGRYPVSLTVNLKPFEQRSLDFHLDQANGQLTACLPAQLLQDIGVNLAALAEPLPAADACIDLPRLIPQASARFDSQRLSLALSIPQVAMRREVSGQIDPARWDSGINAAFVNYQLAAHAITATTCTSMAASTSASGGCAAARPCVRTLRASATGPAPTLTRSGTCRAPTPT